LCASGVTCAPPAHRLTNNQVKFLPLLAERISVSVSAYGGWSLSAQNHTNIGRKNKSMRAAGAESCSSRLSRDVTCPPLAELVRLWRNLCASGVTCAPLAHRLTNNIV
jgi:hypothetical protein